MGFWFKIFARLISCCLVLLQAIRDEFEATSLSVYVVQVVLAVRQLGFREPDGLPVQGGSRILVKDVLPPPPDQNVLKDLGYPVWVCLGTVPGKILTQASVHLGQSVPVWIQEEFKLLEDVPGREVLWCR